ncbi:MAG: tetratricopeptide repeat protein [Promethearchaeota archaeon]
MENTINYPPNEILEPPSKLSKPNFELVILWMVNNNESCQGADFLAIQNSEFEPILSKSTLYNYLKTLIKDGYVNKGAYNKYQITPKGKDRFYELSQLKFVTRKLSYPPKAITYRRNYNHWILWMVYNNNFCTWGDFLDEPLSINQSSLSKNLNSLIHEGYVRKENKEYRITPLGKSAYSNMLREYDLDRQSILEEESKRIKEITKNTIKFFEKFHIKNNDIKFRYLNNVLRLPYDNEKVKEALDNQEDFNKILLFLSLNHPNEFPNFISTKDFSKKYNINQVKLEFILLRIIDENIYPAKFFKLELEKNQNYYFQANEKLERMLNAIVEEHVAKFTYLHNLYEEDPGETPPLTLEFTVEAILNEICGTLFSRGLRDVLRKFLPDYIKYLAYKIEREKKLIETFDKLEGLIWQEIQAYHFDNQQVQFNEQNVVDYDEALRAIDKAIKLNPEDMDLYYSKSKILINVNRYREALVLFDKMLEDFPKEEKNIQMKKAYVLKEMRNAKAGLEIIEELIEKYPEDDDLLNYKACWLQYLNKKEESLEIIQNLIKRVPNNATYHDTYGEILMFFNEYEHAIEEFLKAMEISSKDWYTYQTCIKLGICYKELENYELAVEYLKKGKKLTDKSLSDHDTKRKWVVIADLFLAEIAQLEADF